MHKIFHVKYMLRNICYGLCIILNSIKDLGRTELQLWWGGGGVRYEARVTVCIL